jgi:hypothetical protein
MQAHHRALIYTMVIVSAAVGKLSETPIICFAGGTTRATGPRRSGSASAYISRTGNTAVDPIGCGHQ